MKANRMRAIHLRLKSMPFESEGIPSLRALIRNIGITTFPKFSTVTDDNPFFGMTRNSSDWMSFETSFGQIITRKVGPQLIQIHIEGPPRLEELENALESVRLAFGFLEGKGIDVVGYEAHLPSHWFRKIYPSVTVTRNRFFPPLGYIPRDQGTSCEQLLSKAANFFHTEQGRNFSDRLRMCWAMSDGYGSPRMLTTCLSVEAMTKNLKTNFTKKISEFENNTIELFRYHINENCKILSESFVKRTLSHLGGLRKNTTRDILNHMSIRNQMAIDDEDIKAWDRIRNPIAHGELLANDPDISKWASKVYDHDRIGNLVNKIVLGAMNYEGPYYDYAEHRPKQFATAPSNVG